MTIIGSGLISCDQRFTTIIGSGLFTGEVVGGTEICGNDLVYDISPSVNYIASGFIASFNYGESLGIGDFVCIKSDNAVWKASYDDDVFSRVIGVALQNASYGSHRVLLNGFIRVDSWSWSLDLDERIIYIGLSGEGTQVQPSGTDEAIQTIATVININTLFFNPSLDYMTHI